MDRAMEGGIDDVGVGVLFGLNTYRYDFVGSSLTTQNIWKPVSVWVLTLSAYRESRFADDIDAVDFPNAISDDIFSKIVAVIRIAVPSRYDYIHT